MLDAALGGTSVNELYFSSTLMWNADLPVLFQTAQTLQVQGIELWAQQFESMAYQEAECLRLMEQYDGAVFVHSKTWDLNFASLNRSARETAIREVKASIDLAATLHAPEVTVHPPRQSLGGNEAFYRELAYQGLTEILSYARRKQVEVSLEVMEKIPKEMMTTQEQVKELTGDLFNEFLYTVDVAHCDSVAEAESFLLGLPRISKLHISNRRGGTYHTTLANGDISFVELWPALESSGYPMVVEGLDISNQYTMLYENMDYIQTLKESTK